jgi:hypothetical protein
MLRFFILFILIVMMPLASANMYRWVDGEGRMHISDSVPPAATQFGYDVLGPDGRVIQHVDAPLSEEELAAEAAARKKAEAAAAKQKAEVEARERRDRILTLTYSSVDEIKLARDERLSLLNSYVQLNQKNLKQKNKELKAVKKQIAPFAENKKPIPQGLAMKQSRLEDEVGALKENISHQEAQIKALKIRFAADIKRFEEIQAEKAAEKAAAHGQ